MGPSAPAGAAYYDSTPAAYLHAVTHGALTIAGLISLGFGMALLFQNQPAGFQVNNWLVVSIAVGLAALWAFVLGKGFAARRRPVTSGKASMVEPQRSPETLWRNSPE